ncbi:MAG: transporter permease [Rhodospirillales bacterium]|nr:transporter permease [Rhodospirillales bacterium]
MSTEDQIADTVAEAPRVSRTALIFGGRCLVVVALLLAWEGCARHFGMLFFAPPLATFKRIVDIAASGALITDLVATLRVSAIGFAIGCAGGVLMPFVLRRLPRLTLAIEPYIQASMGIPKYALAPWLILWFGIGDAPKLIVVSIMVFYVMFIQVFAGIRAVDQRLVNMARIAGASEMAIARDIVWASLMPYLFTGLKIAMPRAVSATIVGEFLVATAGIGYSIEHARQLSDTVGVFAGIAVAIVLVLAIHLVVDAIERRILAWRPVDRDMEL